MVKAYKLHKISGISAGLVLFVLSVSGFFLDHDKWDFLYSTTFGSVPTHLLKEERKLVTSYYQDRDNPSHIIVGSYRGAFEIEDAKKQFKKITSLQVLSIIPYNNKIYLATSNGIYLYDQQLKLIALNGKYITAMSIVKDTIVAVVDKKELYVIDAQTLKILKKTDVEIQSSLLQEDISLSRFVRDLHYARGMFDGDLSLILNDYGAIVLIFLAISGYLIWFLIKTKKSPKTVHKLTKFHANFFVILAIFPLTVLSVTGIFLDHASTLSKFMRSITLSHTILPPVYHTLKNDIWSVDYDGQFYRIGNRYGIYKSADLKEWSLENRGFAYKMIRKEDTLYISGMGSHNRMLKDGKYSVLKNTPHMFRDVVMHYGVASYFSVSNQHEYRVPHFDTVTLYTLLLTLHDGSFFSSWWIWINDIGATLLLVLCITGTVRWVKKKKRMRKRGGALRF